MGSLTRLKDFCRHNFPRAFVYLRGKKIQLVIVLRVLRKLGLLGTPIQRLLIHIRWEIQLLSVLAAGPEMRAPKTYNTAHPNYDHRKVRNYPGRLFDKHGGGNGPQNIIYRKIRSFGKEVASVDRDRGVPDVMVDSKIWKRERESCMAEIKTIATSKIVFERMEFIENYVRELSDRNQAYYMPGWITIDDALFLYWLVRNLKPRMIAQTGVCNGLSSAFMMLALAKNGDRGSLHVIDQPQVYNPNSPEWHSKGTVYGVIIPEGKSSGWMVPDNYHKRFELLIGDAKELLPGLLNRLGEIDMFFHDSDHTYDHMMFEMREAKKHLRPGGVIVADDVSWNASVWDFADQENMPAFNYQGSLGVAFF